MRPTPYYTRDPSRADPADVAAGFFGGVLTTGAAATVFTIYRRARFGGAGYARGGA